MIRDLITPAVQEQTNELFRPYSDRNSEVQSIETYTCSQSYMLIIRPQTTLPYPPDVTIPPAHLPRVATFAHSTLRQMEISDGTNRISNPSICGSAPTSTPISFTQSPVDLLQHLRQRRQTLHPTRGRGGRQGRANHRIPYTITRSSSRSNPQSLSPNPFGNLQYPKQFQFICVCENGKDSPVLLPKFHHTYYTRLQNRQMIKTISFSDGNHDHCRRQILEGFSHLPLNHFQFYKSIGNTNYLTSVPVTDANVDIRNIMQFVSYVLQWLMIGLQAEVYHPKRFTLDLFHPQSFQD
jgi:hypothetical protein